MPRTDQPGRTRYKWDGGPYPKLAKTPKAPHLAPDEQYPLFSRLAVETCAACNRSCGFCPVSDGRRKGLGVSPMSRALFASICDQLKALRWVGFVELYILNEPLLDPYLRERAELLKEASPRSTVFISTNGDVLDRRRDRDEYLLSLYEAGVDSINLNIYDEGEEQAARYRGYFDHWVRSGLVRDNPRKYLPVNLKYRWMSLTDMRVEVPAGSHRLDPFYDRKYGDRDRDRTPSFLCPHPSRTLTIRHDGKVMPCCVADPTHPATQPLGDVNTERLADLWNNDEFARYRHFLGRGMRSELPSCVGCTYKNHWSAMMRRVDGSEADVARWRARSAAEAETHRVLIQLELRGRGP